jgi:hypothetical protein
LEKDDQLKLNRQQNGNKRKLAELAKNTFKTTAFNFDDDTEELTKKYNLKKVRTDMFNNSKKSTEQLTPDFLSVNHSPKQQLTTKRSLSFPLTIDNNNVVSSNAAAAAALSLSLSFSSSCSSSSSTTTSPTTNSTSILMSQCGNVSGKTPKSALLEKRRKAVFELLQDEIYPSDEKMSDFLRQNEHLFSNKREFLTKLREVRQKCMNITLNGGVMLTNSNNDDSKLPSQKPIGGQQQKSIDSNEDHHSETTTTTTTNCPDLNNNSNQELALMQQQQNALQIN